MELSQLGLPIRKKNEWEMFFSCPYHDDLNGHLGINLKKGIYHCYRCNVSGRLKNLEKPLSNFNQIVSEFIKGKESIGSKEKREELSLPHEFKLISEKNKRAYNYLLERDITVVEMKKYKIGFCSEGIFMERIIFPIYDDSSKLIYFLGRSYTGREPRYMNAPVSKDKIIFKTFSGRVKQAIIVEGIFDALKVAKIMPAISILGKVASIGQLQSILESTESSKVMLDRDAYVDGFKLYKRLSSYQNSHILLVNEKDAGEMSMKKLQEVLHADIHYITTGCKRNRERIN